MKLSYPRRALTLGACTAVAVAGISAFGVVQASAAGEKPLDVILGVGASQSEKVVSWYFPTSAQQAIQVEEGTALDASAKTIIAISAPNSVVDSSTLAGNARKNDDGTVAAPTKQDGYYNAHVTLSDLKPNTKYTYKVGAADGSGWSPAYTFFTGTASDNFKFAFFGDPQIGSSGYSHNDGRGWATTLNYLKANDTDTELLVSGGDQVEAANNEYDWSNWADPDTSTALKEYPWAPTIGNHEGGYSEVYSGGTPTLTGRAYAQHFFPPNETDSTAFFNGDPSLRPGGDYWYIYKGVLFIDLNSNAYASGSDAAHVAYVSDVIKNHGTGTKWQVLVYHHAIYSPADHANDADNKQRATDFTYQFSKLGVDLVLQGHDHAYSRSYALKAGATDGSVPVKANAAEQPGASTVTPGPGGVLYVTADSASGSKFYDLTTPDTAKRSDYGADTLPGKNDANQDRHWANSVESQQYTPTYVKVEVADGKLTVTDLATQAYNADTNSAVKYGKTGQRKKPDGVTTYNDTELAALGDQRSGVADIHHLQAPGAVTDKFDLLGGNTENFPPAKVTQVPGPTVQVPGPVVQVPVPTNNELITRAFVDSRIKSLTKQIKKAKGTKKKTLKAQLAVYKAIRAKLK